jgi:SAM-dependent methyltransferase
MNAAATTRFSNRVENYIKYRPSYPEAALDILANDCGIKRGATIADIGSGTGIFSALLLERGYNVIGVEPNREMRDAAERLLLKHPLFTSIDGSAEATTLEPNNIDAIAAAQAFHWFKLNDARAECKRILKPNGYAVLLFNERLTDATPFLEGYENLLLRYAIDYNEVNHVNIGTAQLETFFGNKTFASRTIPNAQSFDFTGLCGRLESSSYAPVEAHENYAPMMRELQRLFEAYSQNNAVQFLYETKVYCGQLS